MRLLASIILSVALFAPSAFAQWTTEIHTDEMTEERSCYAHSPMTSATERMSFPYQDVEAYLGVGFKELSEWAYVGFSTAPNLTGSTTKEDYDEFTARIKWDDKVEKITLTQEWGSKFLNFLNDEAIISKMMSANTVLLELNWYGEGKICFRFSLTGSSAAITSARFCR